MKTDNREFFEQLGDLFYSLAVDRSMEPIEFSELKMLISKDWMAQPQDSDLPIPQNVHFMFVEMDTLQATEVSSAEAYSNFARFYAMHPEVFTDELVERIKETASAINNLFPAHFPAKKDHFGDLQLLLSRKENIES
jgi:hypothetical protein